MRDTPFQNRKAGSEALSESSDQENNNYPIPLASHSHGLKINKIKHHGMKQKMTYHSQNHKKLKKNTLRPTILTMTRIIYKLLPILRSQTISKKKYYWDLKRRMIYHCHIHKFSKKVCVMSCQPYRARTPASCYKLITAAQKIMKATLRWCSCSPMRRRPPVTQTAWTSSLWRLQATRLAPMHNCRALACYNNLTLT